MVLCWIESFLLNRFRLLVFQSVQCYKWSPPRQCSRACTFYYCCQRHPTCCMSDSVNVKWFADDGKIYTVITGNESPTQFQNGIYFVAAWSDNWQLSLSSSKWQMQCFMRIPTISLQSLIVLHIGVYPFTLFLSSLILVYHMMIILNFFLILVEFLKRLPAEQNVS